MRVRSESESESDEEESSLEESSDAEESASDEDEDEEGDDSYRDLLMNRERSIIVSYAKSRQNAGGSLDEVQGLYTSSTGDRRDDYGHARIHS